MIENTFVSIGADDELLSKIRNSALTEENMIEFIGILEQRGLDLIGEYSRLLAEVTSGNLAILFISNSSLKGMLTSLLLNMKT